MRELILATFPLNPPVPPGVEEAMFTIRADASQRMLRLDLSGRVVTREALRALSQAFSMAETSRITAIQCDVTEIERGPARLLMLAAVFSVRWHEPMRIAFVGRPVQAPFVRRFINFSGRSHAMGFFVPSELPQDWLLGGLPPPPARPPRLSGTARRHARQLLGIEFPGDAAEPAAPSPEAGVQKPAA